MDASKDRVRVAVGIILGNNHKVLMAQRQAHQHQPFAWEFPGGKIEQDESVECALKRELFEEVGIRVLRHAPFLTLPYDYPDKKVTLFVHQVLQFEGEPIGKEKQIIRWVGCDELMQYNIPKANEAIVKALQTSLLIS